VSEISNDDNTNHEDEDVPVEKRNDQGRRKADHAVLNKTWARIGAIAITIGGSVAAERTVGISDRFIPAETSYQREHERAQLIMEFRQVQTEVAVLKAELSRDRSLSTDQRNEILNRLARLEDNLQRWFERAGRPKDE
jgi:hypothetical protein